MDTVLNIISEQIKKGFSSCGYDEKFGIVSVSNRPDLCQFQCNGALSSAKLYHSNPMVIAQNVCDTIQASNDTLVLNVIKPGLINISLNDAWISNYANTMLRDATLGLPISKSPETIIVDYGGPNVAKPLHIGHLRAAIIGESLKRIMRMLGHNVIGDVHLGDWGLQLGLVIAELSYRYPEWPYFSDDRIDTAEFVPNITPEMLCEVYPLASAKSKVDNAFKDKAHLYTVRLQNREPQIFNLWKQIMNVSLHDLKQNYSKLNVSFDLWLGESDADEYVDEMLHVLNKKELLVDSDGAKVVVVAQDNDKYTIPPVIITKSDNSINYEATDIATIMQREHDYHPDRIWYVVDNRQQLHFVQVFRCARKAQLVPETTELAHLGFGTMNGENGKPYKTRDGGVMKLEDLISMVVSAAREIVSTSDYVSPETLSETAEKVGIASIKFGDLINHRSKDYVFDLKKFVSFEGKTGTYILYTLSRINSLISKADCNDNCSFNIGNICTDAERNLLLELITNSTAYKLAEQEKAPSYICEKTYNIAVAFSGFYRDNRILNESDCDRKQSLVSICELTKKILEMNLSALAIEPVECM